VSVWFIYYVRGKNEASYILAHCLQTAAIFGTMIQESLAILAVIMFYAASA